MAIIIQNFMLLDTEVIEKALSSQNRVQNTYLFIRAARTTDSKQQHGVKLISSVRPSSDRR